MHSNEARGPESGDPSDVSGDGESTVEQLSAELAAARDALDALRESGLREHADLENQRKRMAREVEQARRFANERVLSDLLPVFDSLEAGLAVETADAAKLREGMELTLKQLGKVAADHGLEPVDPAGASFDPDQHQAISTVASEAHPDGTVVQVFQKGYRLNQRLVRPALVVVSRTPD
jgi:molecular chaperone GrpE